jgi:hypothetical protein
MLDTLGRQFLNKMAEQEVTLTRTGLSLCYGNQAEGNSSRQ